MGNSSGFVEMMLTVIRDTLQKYEAVTGQDTDQDIDQDAQPQVRKILEVLGNKTLSAAEMMGALGLSHRQTFRKNYLDPALKQGVIERTIPDKPNSRNQRYRRCSTIADGRNG